LLPKRSNGKRREPMTSSDVSQLMLTIGLHRIQEEMARYERLAESYAAEARNAEQMAARMRAKAAEIRASLQGENPA
jgi:hypothetical protein